MQKKFDTELSRHIKQKFSEHKEEYNPEHWELMKKKLSDNKKRFFLFPWGIAKAASVILFAAIATMIPVKTFDFYSENIQIKNICKEDKPDSKIVIVEDESDLYPKTENYKQNKRNNPNQNKLNIAEIDSVATDNYIAENPDSLVSDESNNKIITKIDTSKQEKKKLQITEETFIAENKSKKINVGIQLNGGYAYETGSNNMNPNIGGGFSVEYKLNKSISLESGLLVANHQFSSGEYANVEFFANEDIAVNNSEAKIMALDIPMNVKLRNKNLIFTAGFSSLVYLNESYSSELAIYNSNYETTLEYYSNTQDFKAFENHDFAKLLNLSVGYEFKLSKGTLIAEPYTKIPLGKMAGIDMKFGHSGFRMQYYF